MFVLNVRRAVVVHMRPVEGVMASMRTRSRVFGTQEDGTESTRGFTLIELLVVIAIIALLISILLPSLGTARSSSRRAVCVSNMKQFGVGVQGYATDFYDKLVAFTWRKGVDYGFGGAANNANLAAANQAVDIMRRRAERTDIAPIDGWIPFPFYVHLVLNDYLSQRLPEPMVACPEDRLRLLWQRSVVPDPLNFHRLAPNNERPGTAGVVNADKRWPYSSTYQFVPAFWSPDFSRPGAATVTQGTSHAFYNVPAATDSTILGERRMSEVQYAGNKVMLFDAHDRHPSGGRKVQTFGTYPQAVIPLMFFDTSVRDVKTSNSNRGFNPATPTIMSTNDPRNFTGVTRVVYDPQPWEPQQRPGQFVDWAGHYRWTRGGLRGVDVAGNEVPVR
jgi:prepilin-type N-terminal cleavage/methylation domain-containing protein